MAKKFDRLAKDLESRIIKAEKKVRSYSFLKRLGKILLRRIIARTRLGYGVVADGGKKVKFPELSHNYKLLRKRLGKDKRRKKKKYTTKLSGKTRPSKSNLTLTGQMLDNTTYEVRGENIIFKGANQEAQDKINWNADWTTRNDGKSVRRIFLRLSNLDVKVLNKFAKKVLRDILIFLK